MANMFDENGNYNKTEWKPGDRITAGKLNKIEESLEAINNNDIERHKEADERLDALEEQKEAVEERFDELEDLVADNKSEVDTAIYEVHSKMDRLEQEMNDGIDTVEAIAHTVDDKIAEADASMKAQVSQGKADMEAMVAEVEGDLEGLHAKDEELSAQLTNKMYYCDNIEELKNNIYTIGDMVITKGYYKANDGGGAKYIINDTDIEVDNARTYNTLNNLKAEYVLENNEINVLQFGAKGDEVFDNSYIFKKVIECIHAHKNDNTRKFMYIPQGYFRIDTSDKLQLVNIKGTGKRTSRITFTHPEGGFIASSFNDDGSPNYTQYNYFFNLDDIMIFGNHTCKNLITVGYASEGGAFRCRFEGAVESIFNIYHQLEITSFIDCDAQNSPHFFLVPDTEYKHATHCLNNIFFQNGYFYNIYKSIINTYGSGNTSIKDMLIERCPCVLNKNNGSFELTLINNNFDVSQGKIDDVFTEPLSNNLINICKKGTDNIILSKNKIWIDYCLNSLIGFNDTSYNSVTSLMIENNKIDASKGDLLNNVVYVNAGSSGIDKIRLTLFKNNFSNVFDWYSVAHNKCNGITVSGIGDIKNSTQLIIGNLAFNGSDFNSGVIGIDSSNRFWLKRNNVNEYIARFVGNPTTSTSVGERGDYSADTNYLYICISSNKWIRIAKTDW